MFKNWICSNLLDFCELRYLLNKGFPPLLIRSVFPLAVFLHEICKVYVQGYSQTMRRQRRPWILIKLIEFKGFLFVLARQRSTKRFGWKQCYAAFVCQELYKVLDICRLSIIIVLYYETPILPVTFSLTHHIV